jgi:serine/threonine protein kinase
LILFSTIPNRDNPLKANYHFGITWKGRGITMQAKEFVKGCLQKDPNKRWTAKQALENLQMSWGPVVDRVWDEWRAEIKKHQEPEFVHPDKIPDDNESNDDGEGAGQSEDDTPPPSNDSKARAKYIKKHVQQVVKDKKKELKREISGSEEIDIMQEVERYTKFGFMKKTILITMVRIEQTQSCISCL